MDHMVGTLLSWLGQVSFLGSEDVFSQGPVLPCSFVYVSVYEAIVGSWAHGNQEM